MCEYTLPPPLVVEAVTESKFETYSGRMISRLKYYLETGKGKVYRHQIKAVLATRSKLLDDEMRKVNGEFLNSKPVLIVAPTGSSKSGIVALLPYVLSSKRVLVITPSRVIGEQLRIDFGGLWNRKSFFEKTEMITETERGNLLEKVRTVEGPTDDEARGENLVIVNAQRFKGKSRLSLASNATVVVKNAQAFFKKFDTIIIHEAHFYPAETWKKIIQSVCHSCNGQSKKLIFLTATPYKVVMGREVFILDSEEDEVDRVAYVVSAHDIKGTKRPCQFLEPRHSGTHENVFKDLQAIFEQNAERERRIVPKAMVLVRTAEEASELVSFLNKKSNIPSFAIRVQSQERHVLEQQKHENWQVAVTCMMSSEYYDNYDIIACVVLRRILTARIQFNKFIAQCTRLHVGLPGISKDSSVAIVLSYKEFGIRQLWNNRNMLEKGDSDAAEDVVVYPEGKNSMNKTKTMPYNLRAKRTKTRL